jgi:hypothetical protein
VNNLRKFIHLLTFWPSQNHPLHITQTACSTASPAGTDSLRLAPTYPILPRPQPARHLRRERSLPVKLPYFFLAAGCAVVFTAALVTVAFPPATGFAPPATGFPEGVDCAATRAGARGPCSNSARRSWALAAVTATALPYFAVQQLVGRQRRRLWLPYADLPWKVLSTGACRALRSSSNTLFCVCDMVMGWRWGGDLCWAVKLYGLVDSGMAWELVGVGIYRG